MDMTDGVNALCLQFEAAVNEAFNRSAHFTAVMEPIGCCPDHEAEFEWFKQHHWQDFPVYLHELGARRDGVTIDNVLLNFRIVRADRYRYYMPGVLLYILQELRDEEAGERFDISNITLVADSILPNGRRDDYLAIRIAFFTDAERMLVGQILELFGNCHREWQGYAYKPDSGFDALAEGMRLWGSS